MDPIVEEIHQIREEMMREVDGDFHKFCENIMASQERHGDRLHWGPMQKFTIPPDMLEPKSLTPPRP